MELYTLLILQTFSELYTFKTFLDDNQYLSPQPQHFTCFDNMKSQTLHTVMLLLHFSPTGPSTHIAKHVAWMKHIPQLPYHEPSGICVFWRKGFAFAIKTMISFFKCFGYNFLNNVNARLLKQSILHTYPETNESFSITYGCFIGKYTTISMSMKPD